MKSIFLFASLLFFTTQISNAQFYQQYFEGTDTASNNSLLIEIAQDSSNVWQIGKPQKAIFDSAATQPYAIVTDTVNFYPINDTSRFIAKVDMNFPNWGIFALRWKQKLDFDTTFDGGTVEYSTDSGSTWVNVFNNPYVYNFYGFDTLNVDTLLGGVKAFNGTDSTWKDIWLCFSSSWLAQFQNMDTILFRFSMVSDSINNNKEGWLIDNMLAHMTFLHTIKEIPQADYLNIYPNPTNNIVHIELEKLSQFHIIEHMELVDVLGKIVAQWDNIPTKFWFETNQYPSGQYILKIKTNIKSVSKTLLISK